MTRSAALVIVFHAAALSSAGAQTPSPPDTALTHRGGYTPPTVTAVRAEIAPALDGRLDDAVWQIAIPATGFRRNRPGDGNPAGERTEVRVAYTGDALYIGARMYTRDPGQVSRLRGRRDSFMQSNDQFQVQIDSYHDHRTAFVFGVTPAGGRNDLVAPNDGYRGIDAGWDPVWDAATRVDSLGWVAEMRIPFSQLRFGDDERQVWGINFRRDIFHLGEGVTWSWRPPTEPGWTSQFGHLLGLAGIRRPGRLEIMPYGVTHAAYDQRADPASPFDDGSVTGGTVGVDLKYGLTGGLTLDATFNPDFGQVEADPAVVNLSAFETRFEERRPFFVEGSGLFGFGGLEGLDFFYSRRVGQRPALSAYGKGTFVDQPRASTILGAAKITGRTESDLVVAFMNATTQREKARFSDGVDMPVGETPVDPLTNTTALRIRKDMRQGSSFIGVVATGVVRDLDDEVFNGLRDRAFAGGVDFLHRFGNRTHSVQGWFGGSYVQGDAPAMLRAQASPVRYYQRPDQSYVEIDPELTSMTGYAGELALGRIAGEWTWGVEGSLVSPGFEMNDAGFQTVADLVAFSGGGGRRWVRPGGIFRNANVNLHFAERRNFGNQVLHRGPAPELGRSDQRLPQLSPARELRLPQPEHPRDPRRPRHRESGPLGRQPVVERRRSQCRVRRSLRLLRRGRRGFVPGGDRAQHPGTHRGIVQLEPFAPAEPEPVGGLLRRPGPRSHGRTHLRHPLPLRRPRTGDAQHDRAHGSCAHAPHDAPGLRRALRFHRRLRGLRRPEGGRYVRFSPLRRGRVHDLAGRRLLQR